MVADAFLPLCAGRAGDQAVIPQGEGASGEQEGIPVSKKPIKQSIEEMDKEIEAAVPSAPVSEKPIGYLHPYGVQGLRMAQRIGTERWATACTVGKYDRQTIPVYLGPGFGSDAMDIICRQEGDIVRLRDEVAALTHAIKIMSGGGA